MVRRGCNEPKSLLHWCKMGLHRCERGFGWCTRLLGDLCSLGSKRPFAPSPKHCSPFGQFPRSAASHSYGAKFYTRGGGAYKRGGGYKDSAVGDFKNLHPPPPRSPLKTHAAKKIGGGGGYIISPWNSCCHLNLFDSASVRENQTCTRLRSTISRHLLPPIPRWGKTWIHTRDPVEILGLPTEKVVFRYRKRANSP